MCVSVSLRKPVISVLPSCQERIPGAKNLDTEKKRFANFPPPAGWDFIRAHSHSSRTHMNLQAEVRKPCAFAGVWIVWDTKATWIYETHCWQKLITGRSGLGKKVGCYPGALALGVQRALWVPVVDAVSGKLFLLRQILMTWSGLQRLPLPLGVLGDGR